MVFVLLEVAVAGELMLRRTVFGRRLLGDRRQRRGGPRDRRRHRAA